MISHRLITIRHRTPGRSVVAEVGLMDHRLNSSKNSTPSPPTASPPSREKDMAPTVGAHRPKRCDPEVVVRRASREPDFEEPSATLVALPKNAQPPSRTPRKKAAARSWCSPSLMSRRREIVWLASLLGRMRESGMPAEVNLPGAHLVSGLLFVSDTRVSHISMRLSCMRDMHSVHLSPYAHMIH